MTKRKFIGLGRKKKSVQLSDLKKKKDKDESYELPDNFIMGLTNQHADRLHSRPKKKVNPDK